MKRATTVALAVLLGVAASASAATINLKVETDKPVYVPGEAVNWQIYAWVNPADQTDGIGLIGVDLADGMGETVSPADTELLAGIFPQLADTAFGLLDGFDKQFAGTIHPVTRTLLDVLVADTSPDEHVSDVGVWDGAGDPPMLAHGAYVVNTLGVHTLDVSVVGATYWESPDVTHSKRFEDAAIQNTTFNVVPEPASLLLLGTGLLGGVGVIGRRNRQS